MRAFLAYSARMPRLELAGFLVVVCGFVIGGIGLAVPCANGVSLSEHTGDPACASNNARVVWRFFGLLWIGVIIAVIGRTLAKRSGRI